MDRLCGLVVRVPGYRTEMYCVSYEVRPEFIYVMWKNVDRLCGLEAAERRCIAFPVRYELNLYVM
jgi:hypothetical protein